MSSNVLHLFIDTNVLLSFYAFTNDDLEELRKITALVQNDKLSLYLTSTVVDEFWKNRETKLDLVPLMDALTNEEVLKLAEAAIENTQIRWIASDEDVQFFYKSILPKGVHLYSSELEEALREAFDLTAADLYGF